MQQLSPELRHSRSFGCISPHAPPPMQLGPAASAKMKSRFSQRSLRLPFADVTAACNNKRQRTAYTPRKVNQQHRFDTILAEVQPLQPEQPSSALDVLPEGVVHVALKLLGPHRTALASEVCQSWGKISKDELLWRDWCKERAFDMDPKEATWRTYFAEQEQARLMALRAFRKEHARTTSMSCPDYNTSLDALQKIASVQDLLKICREGRGSGVLQLLALHALVLRRDCVADSNVHVAIRDLLRQLPQKRDTCIDIEWWQLGERDFQAGIRAPDHHVMHSTSFEGLCRLLASQFDRGATRAATRAASPTTPDETGGQAAGQTEKRCLSLLNDRTFLGRYNLSAITVVNWRAEGGRPSWQTELLATADERYRSWYYSGMRLEN